MCGFPRRILALVAFAAFLVVPASAGAEWRGMMALDADRTGSKVVAANHEVLSLFSLANGDLQRISVARAGVTPMKLSMSPGGSIVALLSDSDIRIYSTQRKLQLIKTVPLVDESQFARTVFAFDTTVVDIHWDDAQRQRPTFVTYRVTPTSVTMVSKRVVTLTGWRAAYSPTLFRFGSSKLIGNIDVAVDPGTSTLAIADPAVDQDSLCNINDTVGYVKSAGSVMAWDYTRTGPADVDGVPASVIGTVSMSTDFAQFACSDAGLIASSDDSSGFDAGPARSVLFSAVTNLFSSPIKILNMSFARLTADGQWAVGLRGAKGYESYGEVGVLGLGSGTPVDAGRLTISPGPPTVAHYHSFAARQLRAMVYGAGAISVRVKCGSRDFGWRKMKWAGPTRDSHRSPIGNSPNWTLSGVKRATRTQPCTARYKDANGQTKPLRFPAA